MGYPKACLKSTDPTLSAYLLKSCMLCCNCRNNCNNHQLLFATSDSGRIIIIGGCEAKYCLQNETELIGDRPE